MILGSLKIPIKISMLTMHLPLKCPLISHLKINEDGIGIYEAVAVIEIHCKDMRMS